MCDKIYKEVTLFKNGVIHLVQKLQVNVNAKVTKNNSMRINVFETYFLL